MAVENADISIHGNTRRLLSVVFSTLLMAALCFVGTFIYFNQLNQRVFREFEKFAKSANINADMSMELVSLELKIRDMLSIVLTSPEELPKIKATLLLEFSDIKEDVRGIELANKKQIAADIEEYESALDVMLQGYTEMNTTLLFIKSFNENLTSQLKRLEEKVGQLMVDAVMSGTSSVGLQQNYILLPLCVEELVRSNMLIRSSIVDNDPSLLGVEEKAEVNTGDKLTALYHVNSLEKTLQTMTSAQEPIGEIAFSLLDQIPSYRQRVADLHRTLIMMRDNENRFKIFRTNVLSSLRDLEHRTAEGISDIQDQIRRHNRHEWISSIFISGSILGVSLLGMLLAWRLSRHLERTAKEATEANEQLQLEIHEKNAAEEALRQSRDELEIRVEERTRELSRSNALLQNEIEERLGTEAHLADERERLLVTLRSIGDGVVSTDIEGRVTLLNQNAETLTGWSHSEAIGRPLQDIMHILDGETRKACENAFDRVLATGTTVESSNYRILVSRDGRERRIADSCAPIHDSKKQIIGLVLVFRDVTEQLRQEKELLKVKKLESVGVLAGGIAHDFNNILSAILGNINLALVDRELNDHTRKILSAAEKASIRAKDLTQQLLTFAKGGEPILAASVLEMVIKDSASFVLRGDNISCRYEIPEDLWLVDIDKGQISQVIQNIVLNASQAMPEGGTIVISGDNLSSFKTKDALSEKKGRFVKICIKDTGVGIPAHVRDRIFDPYFTTKQEGSGLGLAITQSIINKHKGFIEVGSRPGEGSSFSIYLPASEGVVAPGETVVSEEREPSFEANILVMDDEEMVRNVTQSMLEALGCHVVLSADGAEALRLYREAMHSKKPINLVIMDLTIPGGMGGMETLPEILILDPKAKVIVSSGYSNDPVMANFSKYGFCSAIVKPFQLQELSKTIGQVLG